MKKSFLVLTLASLMTISHAEEPKIDIDKVSYALGFGMGERLAGISPELTTLNNEEIIKGMQEALAKKESKLSLEETEKLIEDFSKQERDYYEKTLAEETKKQSEENTKVGKKLLEENKKKEGVKVTKSGLQYRVIKEADGDKPKATDKVKVHYKGKLPDGKEFDSSYSRGEPVTFLLNAVIPGWVEGLQLMPIGSTYELVIPANIAYGSDAPNSIGPNQVLTFEIELLEIVK